MEIGEIEIPKGKFALLGGSKDGYGFSHCGTFDTLEEAKAERSWYVSVAPSRATMHARAIGENLDHRTLIDPESCLRYLGISFVIYNDQKQVVVA